MAMCSEALSATADIDVVIYREACYGCWLPQWRFRGGDDHLIEPAYNIARRI